MSGFRYVSVASIIAIFYILIVMLVELKPYVDQNFSSDNVVYAYFDWNIFTGASITFFAYTC